MLTTDRQAHKRQEKKNFDLKYQVKRNNIHLNLFSLQRYLDVGMMKVDCTIPEINMVNGENLQENLLKGSSYCEKFL